MATSVPAVTQGTSQQSTGTGAVSDSQELLQQFLSNMVAGRAKSVESDSLASQDRWDALKSCVKGTATQSTVQATALASPLGRVR